MANLTNSGNLIDAINSKQNLIIQSANQPSNPNTGDYRYDTTNKLLKYYNGSSWDPVGANVRVLTQSEYDQLTPAEKSNGTLYLITGDSDQLTIAWENVTDKPTFATVATSGAYNDLSGKPTIPTVNDTTITFTQNGVSVGDITLNQSSAETIALTDTTYTATDFDIKDLTDSTNLRSAWSGKQDALSNQTAYTTKGTSTKVPTISTNSLGQVTAITETDISFPVTSVNGQTGNVTVASTKYAAGEGIEISDGDDYSAVQGPAPDGFHVPSRYEWVALYDILINTFLMANNATTIGTYLKMPMAGYRIYGNGDVRNEGSQGYYRSYTPINTNEAFYLYLGSEFINPQNTDHRSSGLPVRCFKNSPVIPTSSWTILYDGSSVASGAGVFHNATNGLISISGDGQTWYTIMDKNLGATTVFNQGDTLTDANCGYFYQWGNNYGFPHSGHVTISTTQVDTTGYGPGNYYSSSTFIRRNDDWSSVQNDNLRGGITGVVILDDIITNIGVLSVNGQTGTVILNADDISDTSTTNKFVTAQDLTNLGNLSGTNTGDQTASDFDIKDLTDSTSLRSTWSGKQDALATQTAYTSKGSATKVPQITTNTLGQVTGITEVTITQPTKTSDLTNDSGFITNAVNDLTNYYKKTETYTQAEVNSLVQNFQGFEIVATLPSSNIKTNVIYLLGPTGSGADKYEEYVYANSTWVKIGDTSVDLTNYFNKSTQTSDVITEGSTNLFLTSAERTKLSNTSGTNTGDQSASDFDIKDLTDSTGLRSTWSGKQDALSSQTAYSNKGTSSKVPTITTNSLGQVTSIAETDIAFPVTSVNGNTGAVTGLQTTANLKTSLSDNSDSYYPSQKAVKTAVDAKQDSLTTQTAYSAKGSATKVPQITTNSLGQVTSISEVTITQPDISGKANTSDVLTKTNTTSYTPSADYHPATKKYVDDNKGTKIELVTQAQYDNIGSEKLTNGVLYGIIES